VPRSLRGRLILLLLCGLLLAQLASALILFRNRGEALYQASGMQVAQRIASIAHLLDGTAPAERPRLAAALQAPPLYISLGRPGLPGQSPETDSLAAGFRAVLARSLGDGRAFHVAISDRPETASEHMPFPHGRGHGHGRGRGRGMGRGLHMGAMMGLHLGGGLAFAAEIQLLDGSWVSFAQRLPKDVFVWPWRLLLALGLLLAAVVALSVWAVRWLTRPLAEFAAAADALGRDLHRPPLPEQGPLEVGRAARAFNTMQARLTRFVEDRTRLLTALSHDLRTPITRLRLRAEALSDSGVRASVTRDLDEMQAMTQATLDFLRGLETQEAPQPLAVDALLESIEEDMCSMGHEVSVQAANARPYPAQPTALKRCLVNLVENAVKYGGRATIVTRDGAAALEIRVLDEGPGIPEPELERVLEPFYRLEASRSRDTGGTGLGLSIARNVARSHGGELVLHNRPEGGLAAVLTLPR